MYKLISAILLILFGSLIMISLLYFQGIPTPPPGEYHYSMLLRQNFTLAAIVIYSIAGFILGYFLELNCFLIGLSLISIFPITSMVEATIYRGSHNLIPFEFAVFFAYGLPATIAAFIGKKINTTLNNRS